MDSTRPPRVGPAKRPHRMRPLRRALAAMLCLATIGTVAVTSSSPGAAQAAFVHARVRIDPPLPQPGQNVTVSVRITGCRPGSTDVQLLLAANDEGGVAGALMADGPARTSLLWRTSARIQLTNAVQGWYGVRIQCGSFRPAQAPMPNTTFAVGANPATTMALSARTVTAGGSVTVSGTHCPGKSVDYEILPKSHNADLFITTASIPVDADGTWSGSIPIGPNLEPGPAIVRARCTQANQLGTTVYISYGRPIDVRIEPAS